MKRIAVSIALLGLACTSAVDEPITEPGPTTFEQLQQRATFMLWGADFDATVTVKLRVGDEWVTQPSRLALRGGYLSAAAGPTGDIVVDTLDVYFDSLRAGTGGLPPTGLHLSAVHVYQETPNRCEHVEWTIDGETCEAVVNTPLMFEADMHVSDGVVIPIGPAPIGQMGTDLLFYTDLAAPNDYPVLTAEMRALAPGSLGDLHDSFELADLVITGVAREMVPLAN